MQTTNLIRISETPSRKNYKERDLCSVASCSDCGPSITANKWKRRSLQRFNSMGRFLMKWFDSFKASHLRKSKSTCSFRSSMKRTTLTKQTPNVRWSSLKVTLRQACSQLYIRYSRSSETTMDYFLSEARSRMRTRSNKMSSRSRQTTKRFRTWFKCWDWRRIKKNKTLSCLGIAKS